MANIKKIFLVEDDEFYQQMLVEHLSKNHAYKVTAFGTGEACLEHLHIEKPDVIVLDYFLNESDQNAASGLVILEKIRKLLPAVHVIMLSAQGKYGVAASTIAKGAEHYVAKDKESFKNITSILESYK
jgi:CheY-like chemotaxis protein